MQYTCDTCHASYRLEKVNRERKEQHRSHKLRCVCAVLYVLRMMIFIVVIYAIFPLVNTWIFLSFFSLSRHPYYTPIRKIGRSKKENMYNMKSFWLAHFVRNFCCVCVSTFDFFHTFFFSPIFLCVCPAFSLFRMESPLGLFCFAFRLYFFFFYV